MFYFCRKTKIKFKRKKPLISIVRQNPHHSFMHNTYWQIMNEIISQTKYVFIFFFFNKRNKAKRDEIYMQNFNTVV